MKRWIGLLALALAAPVAADEATTAGPLAGDWTFNAEESDDAREKMRAAHGAGRGRRGGGGPPGGGGRRGGERGGMRGIVNPPQRLSVAVTDSELTFATDGRTRTLYTDGRELERRASGRPPSVAAWSGHTLVVTTESARGKLEETYDVSPDGERMTVTVRMTSERLAEPVVLLRVYDRAAAE